MKDNSSNNKEERFKIPNNYFENFQNRLTEKLTSENKNNANTKVTFLNADKLKYIVYIAASVILVAGIFFSYNTKKNIESPITIVMDTISKAQQNLDMDFSITKNNDELMALFVEDEYIDEYLDNYLIEGVIAQD